MEPQSNQSETFKLPRKKRVLFVITQSEIGGAQQFLAQLISHLNPQEFDCSVVVGADGDHSLKSLLPDTVPYRIARHLRRDPSIISDIKSLFELRAIFKEERPDVIFLNSSKAGFNGSWAASALPFRLTGVHVIYRIGGWQFNDPLPRWKRLFYIFLEKVSARWKDVIIVNNQRDLADAQRLNIKPRYSLKLIHNGITPYLEIPDKETARVQLISDAAKSALKGQAALFQTPCIVGTIANFYATKGLSVLIDAAAKVRSDAVFIIIGDGELRPALEQQIINLGLAKKVFLLGKKPRAINYISGFDLFVLPSLKEGFPWTLLEAVAAKVPVIATRTGAVPEIIESGRNGIIVPPGDAEKLAQAIDELIENPRLGQEMAIQAHQNLIKNFSLHDMIQRYEHLLRNSL